MNTEHVNHDPASKFLHTGFQIAGRPSTGAWVSYALGSDNKDLPMFVVMSSGNPGGVPIDASTWAAGFMPSHYQGVQFRSGQEPVPYIESPDGHTRTDRREMLDAIASSRTRSAKASNDPEIPSKISQYEMAYRMQESVPEIADISNEPEHVLDLYGPDVQEARHLRAQLPAGAPSRRARRALHDGGADGLGSPRRHRRAAPGELPRGRSAVGGAGRRT